LALSKRNLIAVVVALVTMLGMAGCSASDGEEAPDPPPEVAGGWARVDMWEHLDVLAFDRVAVGNDPDTLAWVTRRTRGETDALAYTELRGNREPTGLDLAAPAPAAPRAPGQAASPDPVLIPVAVGTGDTRWTALAVTRDSPRGDNTGVVAWQGARSSDGAGGERTAAPASRLAIPEGVEGAPESVGVATIDDVDVAVALVGGEPVIWRRTGEGSDDEAGRWAAVENLNLGVDGSLISLRVAADRDRLVLAGVDESGRPMMRGSSNGEDWIALGSDALPDASGGVALLTPVDGGGVVVGWLADEESAPRYASEVVLQTLDGDTVDDEGTIAADDMDGASGADVNGAVRSPDNRLLVVGAVIRRSGEAAPMVWAQQGDDWIASEQTELAGRIDYEMRTAMAHEDTVVALVTNRTHIDVESWRWQTGEG
jgi:hypothetical protein